jgi:hypothetical protein
MLARMGAMLKLKTRSSRSDALLVIEMPEFGALEAAASLAGLAPGSPDAPSSEKAEPWFATPFTCLP